MAEIPATDRSDEDLLVRLRHGDPEAAGILYDRHHQGLYAYALSLLREASTSEDVVHETFLRVLEHRPEEPVACAKAFLHTIARNLALDVIRGVARQGDHRRFLAMALLARAPQAGETEDPRAKLVLAALDALPQDQRETVSLKVFSRLTFAQIAEVMSVPAGTAASRYRYALARLAEILSAEGETR